MTTPTIGTNAPDFELPRDGGDPIRLSTFRGQNVVLYFYPRDGSPQCTIEAVSFSDLLDAFASANCAVLGVSKDPIAQHDEFCKKYNLGVPLLSDADSDVCEKYGVWREKTTNGERFMGIVRTTFLISTTGVILQIWDDVDVDEHSQSVLLAAQRI